MSGLFKFVGLSAVSVAVCALVGVADAATGRAGYANVRAAGPASVARMPSMPTLPINSVGNISTNVPTGGTNVVPDQPDVPDNPDEPEPPIGPECPDGGVKNSAYTVDMCMDDVLRCVNYGALQNLSTFSGLRVDVVPGGTTRTEKTTTPANLMVELLWQRRSWLAWSLAVSVGEAEASYYDSRGVLLGTTEYVPFAVSLGLRTRYVAIGRFSAYGVWGLNYCGGVMSNDYYKGEPKMAGLDAVLIDCYPFNFAFGRSHGLAMGVGVGSRGIFNLNYFVNF